MTFAARKRKTSLSNSSFSFSKLQAEADFPATKLSCPNKSTNEKSHIEYRKASFNLTNAKFIIHAVGPDFSRTPTAFKELFDAYYNSLCVLKENDLHSISFPLISSGIFGGRLADPVAESTKQCCSAYNKFIMDYPDYEIEVKLCAYTANEMSTAKTVIDSYKNI